MRNTSRVKFLYQFSWPYSCHQEKYDLHFLESLARLEIFNWFFIAFGKKRNHFKLSWRKNHQISKWTHAKLRTFDVSNKFCFDWFIGHLNIYLKEEKGGESNNSRRINSWRFNHTYIGKWFFHFIDMTGEVSRFF